MARFESASPQTIIEDVKNLLNVKLHEVIMRSIIAKIEDEQSLVYQRPQSLEEAPAREVGSFMKESKSDMMHDADDMANQD